MDIEDCLKYSVGLSKNDCECVKGADGERPEDYNRSDSGYFLDDMEIAPPLVVPKAATDCLEFWAMMEEARSQGIRDFVTDFVVKSKMYTHIKVSPFDGDFADTEKVTSVLTGINKQFMVAMYKPINYVRGANMETRSIGLNLNLPGTYTVNLYKSTNLITPEHSIDVTVVTPGTLASAAVPANEIPWKLPMWENDKKLTWYFTYDAQGAKPYNMRFNCGCTGSVRPWERHLYAKGIQTDDISRLEIDAQTHASYSYGLLVSGSLACDGFEWMCRTWDFKTDSFGRVMARLVQLYSIRKLHALILNSRRINAFTLLNPESLQNRMLAISQMIDDPVQGNIGYLFNNIPKGVTGCWECEKKFYKGSILV